MGSLSKYACYVKFKDPKSTLHVSWANDVLDFNPAHSDDFKKDKLYKIFWQEGQGSFDGYFEGWILCMAGTCPLSINPMAHE